MRRVPILFSAAALALGIAGGVSDAAVEVLSIGSNQTAYWATSSDREDMVLELSYWQKSPLAYVGYSSSRGFASSREHWAAQDVNIAADSIAIGAPSQTTDASGFHFRTTGLASANTVFGASETEGAVYSAAGTTVQYVFDVTGSSEAMTLSGSVHADPWQEIVFRFSRRPISVTSGPWETVPGFSPVLVSPDINGMGTLQEEAVNQPYNQQFSLEPGYRYQIDLKATVEASAWDTDPSYSAKSSFNVNAVVPEPGVLAMISGLVALPLLRRRRIGGYLGL